MNCRRVSNLLSAYLDAELTGAEMLEIRKHLDCCPSCRVEKNSLSDTKQLISSLALRTPRAEFESLLLAEVERMSSPLARWMPSWLVAWQAGVVAVPRPRPIMATAALSLAGLLLATSRVDQPSQVATPDVYHPYVDQHVVSSYPVRSARVPLPAYWDGNRSAASPMFGSLNVSRAVYFPR